MNRFALLTLIPVLALTGCRGAGGDLDADAQEDFAATFEDDIEDLATSVEDLATSAGALTEEGARETAEDCYATFGDCSVCYSIDGGYLTGLFSAVTTPTPCGATLTVRSASATYTVLESALDGTWAATSLAGDYAIAMTGTRSAELTTSTTRRGTSTIDSSWTLDAMSATTVDFLLDNWAVDVTYTGFAGHVWEADVAGDTTGLTGTATVDDGSVTCTVGGTWALPTVSCE